MSNFTQKSLERCFAKTLSTILDFVFESHPYESFADLSKAAGLSASTIYKLYNRETVTPHFRTVYKLCIASGVSVIIQKDGSVQCETVLIKHSVLARLKKVA